MGKLSNPRQYGKPISGKVNGTGTGIRGKLTGGKEFGKDVFESGDGSKLGGGAAPDPWGSIATQADVLYKLEEASDPISDFITSAQSMDETGTPLFQQGTTNGQANGVFCSSSEGFRDEANSLTSWDVTAERNVIVSIEFEKASGSATGRRILACNNNKVGGWDGWYIGFNASTQIEVWLLDDSGNSVFHNPGGTDYKDDTRHRWDIVFNWTANSLQVYVDDPGQTSISSSQGMSGLTDNLISNSTYGPAIGMMSSNSENVDATIYGVSILFDTTTVIDW